MWLFAQHGFFSIIANDKDKSILIVRARIKGDIEKYFPDATIVENEDSDYRYRAYLPRNIVQREVGRAIGLIHYTNYKASISDKLRRSRWYAQVWNIMAKMQDFLHH